MDIVSIIIPVFNVEEYLQYCIETVIHQSYRHIEIILVDDGSSDSSGKICDEYAKKDKRIIVIHKENSGVSDSRNVGLEKASGKYITFVDSDDYVSTNYINHLLSALKENGADIAFSSWIYVYNQCEREDSLFNLKNCCIWNAEETLKHMMLRNKITGSVWGGLSKRELWTRVRFPRNKKHSEDYYVNAIIISKIEKAVFIDEVLYFYYVRPNSIQNASYSPQKMEEIELVKASNRKVVKQFPRLKEASINRLVSGCFHVLFFMNDFFETSEESKQLITIIKKYRLMLIFGKDVNGKVRLACLTSYFSLKLTKFLYFTFKMRGKIEHKKEKK